MSTTQYAISARKIRNNTNGQSFWYPVIGQYVMRSRPCWTRENALQIAQVAAADLPR